MIKSIQLKGFKSFLDRDINFSPLTVLTGLNSSGKSTVIQALLMLEKAAKNEKSVLLTGHGTAKELKNPNSADDIGLSVEIEDNFFAIEIPVEKTDMDYKITSEGFKGEFPEIIYVSADRFGPRVGIEIYNDSNMIYKIGPNGENVLQCIKHYEYDHLNENLFLKEAESDQFIFVLSAWLNRISPNTKFNYELVEVSDSSYTIFNEHRSTNVGFGLSYILPVITALLVGTLTPRSIVIIENPEAHLHPKGQTEIAKLIALCVKSGTQVLIETHSDHIFDGIRIAAKQFGDFGDNVQFHWFELDADQLTDVTSPIMDDAGRLDEWPTNFFDQFEINSSELL
ncbi:AAA family ATPase [Mucilaginibacter sp.]